MLPIYRTWRISYSASRPVTGTFVAEKYGVTLSANSEELLHRMLDTRAIDYPWEFRNVY